MDKLFFNGRVNSLDRHDRVYRAVGVTGEKITALGEEAELRKSADSKTELIDLQGAVMFPGFIDSHTHFLVFAYLQTGLNLADPGVKRLDDVLRLIKDAAEKTRPGEWIRGSRFTEYWLAENRYPTRWDLDQVSPDHPVILWHTSFHACVLNSKGLAALGITRSSRSPDGGLIEKDPSTGEPNGVLQEAAMMNMAFRVLYPQDLEAMTPADRMAMVVRGMEKFNQVGVTAVADCLVTPTALAVYQETYNAGLARLRVYLMPELLVSEGLMASGLKTGFGHDWLKIGPIKIFIDGGMSNRSAAVSTPYLTPPHGRGMKMMSRTDLMATIKRVDDLGFQISVHCQGDDALTDLLDAFEGVLGPVSDNPRRHRIEHAGCLYPRLLERAAAMKLGVGVQPVFLSFLGDGFIEAFGRDGAGRLYPFRDMLAAGLALGGGSDCPVSEHDPRLSFRDAVLRRTVAGEIIGPDQTLTMNQVLKLFTSGSAYLNHEDHLAGTIEPGKRADFAVLAEDPQLRPAEEAPHIPVVMTVVGGRIVHRQY
ncbi:MAG: amidohydrolase [Thermodesulfobacteriota bacterium]